MIALQSPEKQRKFICMKDNLKNELHQIIDAIEDEQTLLILKEDLASYTLDQNIDGLTPTEFKELKEALEEVERGEGLQEWQIFKNDLETRWREK